jgi:hypothetical protein
LLDSSQEISKYTTAVASQWLSSHVVTPADTNGTIPRQQGNSVFYVVPAKKQVHLAVAELLTFSCELLL